MSTESINRPDVNNLVKQIHAIINAWRAPDKFNYAELIGALSLVVSDIMAEAREVAEENE